MLKAKPQNTSHHWMWHLEGWLLPPPLLRFTPSPADNVFPGTSLFSDRAGVSRVWWVNAVLRQTTRKLYKAVLFPYRFWSNWGEQWVSEMIKHRVANRVEESQLYWRRGLPGTIRVFFLLHFLSNSLKLKNILTSTALIWPQERL